jgi:TolB protein
MIKSGIISVLTIFLSLTIQAQKQQYKIVFNVLEDQEKDNYDIYSMNMDGTDKKNITNTPGVEWVYYAYKEKVYYISDIDTCHRCYFLYEMDAEGNNKRKISSLQLEDSWMSSRKNGKQMIVTGRIGNTIRRQLFIIDIKTGNYKQITYDTISYKVDPVFVGSDVLVRYRPDKNQRQTVPAEIWNIGYLKKGVDTIIPNPIKYQITHFPKTDIGTKWFEYHAGPPQWNSKLGIISYLSKQNGQTQIFLVFPDLKKGFQSVTTTQLTNGELSSGYHSWSSDGKWLAMDKATPDEKSYDIYLMNYKTKKTIQLTSDPKYEQAPVLVEVKK